MLDPEDIMVDIGKVVPCSTGGVTTSTSISDIDSREGLCPLTLELFIFASYLSIHRLYEYHSLRIPLPVKHKIK